MVVRPTLLVVALILTAVAPVLAGTSATPEVPDNAGDVKLNDAASPCSPTPIPNSAQCPGPGGFADLYGAWVDSESSTEIVLKVNSANTANAYGPQDVDFHFKVGGNEYVATFHYNAGSPGGDGAKSAGGAASSVDVDDDSNMVLTVLRSAIGNPPMGAKLTELYVTSKMTFQAATFTDRAPDTGFGTDYTLKSGPAATAAAGNATGGVKGNTTKGGNSTATPPGNSTAAPSGAPANATASGSPSAGADQQASGAPSASNGAAANLPAETSSSAKSPGVAAGLLLLGMVGLAFVARRRK